MNITRQQISEGLIIEMPENMALGFNPAADDFDWIHVLPSNYWSLELVKERKEVTGQWPVVTPAYVKLQPVYDPEVPEGMRDLRPKIVLYFKENVPALVMNKSRCQLASKMTGYRNPGLWAANMPVLTLKKGDFNDRVQVVFEPAPPHERGTDADLSIQEANALLELG